MGWILYELACAGGDLLIFRSFPQLRETSEAFESGLADASIASNSSHTSMDMASGAFRGDS